MSIFVNALDLGQIQDYTAMVTVEAHGTIRLYPPDGGVYARRVECLPITSFDVRHAERWKLGTKYMAIAAEVREKVKQLPVDRTYFAVDQTGVGNAVIEMFLGMNPIGVTITGAGIAKRDSNLPQQFHVPKGDLVSKAQVAFQNQMLRISTALAKSAQGEKLLQELGTFKEKISVGGGQSYEAWRERDHDDLVLALAIGVWVAEAVFAINTANISRPPRQDPPGISPI